MISFDVFVFDPQSGELRNRETGSLTRLRPKPAAVLALLASRPGEVLSRDEIISSVWPGQVIEFDLGLNACVRDVRAALGDDASQPRFIQTLPRRGYRFLATNTARDTARPVANSRRIPRLAIAISGLVVASFLVVNVFGDEDRVVLGVLPIHALGADSQTIYLASAMTAEIISQLSQVNPRRLAVIARTSIVPYASTTLTVAEIGRELGAEFLVEGTMRRSERNVRMDVRLIRVSDQSQTWSTELEIPTSEVFSSSPQEIASAVATDLKIGSGSRTSPVPPVPADSVFRDNYLRARYHISVRSKTSLEKAADLLRMAIERDDGYAPAWDALAETRLQLSDMEGARHAAERAVGLAPNWGVALARRAVVRVRQHIDLVGGLQDAEEARASSGGDAFVQYANAFVQTVAGNSRAAINASERALRLDPVSPLVLGDVGWFFLYADKPVEALTHCRRASELNPRVTANYQCQLTALIVLHRSTEALTIANYLLGVEGRAELPVVAHESATGDEGLRRFWRAVADGTISTADSALPLRAFARAQLRRPMEAIATLDTARLVLRPIDFVFVLKDPLLNPVRHTPEFQDLAALDLERN